MKSIGANYKKFDSQANSVCLPAYTISGAECTGAEDPNDCDIRRTSIEGDKTGL
jgi:hypothetical protein